MKNLLSFGLFASIILVACAKKDEKTPIVVDFNSTVTGQAPNAQITIVNKSTGASNYQWTFGTGANAINSTEKDPASFNVDKVGDFVISLKVSDGIGNKEMTKTLIITGNNPIVVYSDLEFGLNAGDSNYGRYFSFETGLMYKDSEINSSNGQKMHLAFGSMDHVMFFFESPTRKDVGFINVPNATQTKVINWENVPTISIAAFDAIQDDRLLSSLTIPVKNDSFSFPLPNMILFEISSGRKGVIKAKAVNSNRLLADIKIQKY